MTALGMQAGFTLGGGTGLVEAVASGGLLTPVAVAQTAGATVAGAGLGRATGDLIWAAKSKLESALGDAKAKYPGKANKDEYHHRTPKYLGGDPDGPTVRINAALHQEITNAFRQLWKYGSKVKPTQEQLKEIMRQVYSRFPIK